MKNEHLRYLTLLLLKFNLVSKMTYITRVFAVLHCKFSAHETISERKITILFFFFLINSL